MFVALLQLGGESLCSVDLAFPLSPSSPHFLIFLFTSGSCLRSYLYTLTLTLLTPSVVFLFSKYVLGFLNKEMLWNPKQQGGEGGEQASLKTGEHSFMNALLLCYMIRVLFAHCAFRADGYSVFCVAWQGSVLKGGSRFDQSFHIDGALGGLSSWPGGPTTSFYRCGKQSFVRPGPQLYLLCLSVSVSKHREIPLEKTASPPRQPSGSRQPLITQ